ncbi:MAG: low molecular weight phosphotyrosine protein phosphatase, partial [Candidatus Competibacteraceae bacterium]|nr:low molecular weight phosphotyrosine protein phosphatase [Candidatus Competibacteraceae bacterium]
QLTEELIRRHDLILVMESGHRRAVEAIDPSARGRIYRWGEWGDFEVPDPYRQPREVFEQSLELILRGLDDWLVKLKA